MWHHTTVTPRSSQMACPWKHMAKLYGLICRPRHSQCFVNILQSMMAGQFQLYLLAHLWSRACFEFLSFKPISLFSNYSKQDILRYRRRNFIEICARLGRGNNFHYIFEMIFPKFKSFIHIFAALNCGQYPGDILSYHMRTYHNTS